MILRALLEKEIPSIWRVRIPRSHGGMGNVGRMGKVGKLSKRGQREAARGAILLVA